MCRPGQIVAKAASCRRAAIYMDNGIGVRYCRRGEDMLACDTANKGGVVPGLLIAAYCILFLVIVYDSYDS